jgi:hypothetical protein
MDVPHPVAGMRAGKRPWIQYLGGVAGGAGDARVRAGRRILAGMVNDSCN